MSPQKDTNVSSEWWRVFSSLWFAKHFITEGLTRQDQGQSPSVASIVEESICDVVSIVEETICASMHVCMCMHFVEETICACVYVQALVQVSVFVYLCLNFVFF
jgi:hypothetical protein